MENRAGETAYVARDAFRWAALILVFTAAMINYIDRQTIALLKQDLEAAFGWSDLDYAHIVSGFQIAIIASTLVVGWFVDRVGLRTGYALGVGGWSLAAMAHAFVSTVSGFLWARIVLGVTEAVNTPAAVKTVATWFRGSDRSMALGIMNTAPNIGAVATPLIVPAVAVAFGWKAAFIVTGALGFVWLAFWLLLPKPTHETPPEPVAISTEAGALKKLLVDRRAWAVATGKFLTDFVWVFLLFWAPDLFAKRYGLTTEELALPTAVVFLLAGAGSFFGGWLASTLLARGRSLNVARKTPMIVAAFMALPVPLVMIAPNVWVGAILLGLTLAAHQAFSTNMFGVATDIFPARTVGLVVGFGATFGSLSGLLMNEFTGLTLDRTGSYAPMLVLCATAKFLAVFVVHVLVPNIDRTRDRMLAESA